MNPKSGILNPYGVPAAVTFANEIKLPLVSIEATFVPLYLKYIFDDVVVIDQLLGKLIEDGEKLVIVKFVIVAFVVTTLVALTVVGLIVPPANTPLYTALLTSFNHDA